MSMKQICPNCKTPMDYHDKRLNEKMIKRFWYCLTCDFKGVKYDVKPDQAKLMEELEIAIALPRYSKRALRKGPVIVKTIPIVKNIEPFSLGVKIEGNNIVGLNLFNRRIFTLPDSITKLTSLKELHLMSNQLSFLPESIGNLNSLEILNLDENFLGANDNRLSTLPESITKLKSLKELRLRENKLTTLKGSIGNISLTSLDLRENKLTTLPESVTKLESLQKLLLGENGLTTLPESIGNLKSLTSLNLRSNQLSFLPEAISVLKSLTYLHLGQNELITLPESIGNLSSLQTLALNNNQLTALPESIGNLTSLQTLSIDANKLTTLPISLWRCRKISILSTTNNAWEGEWVGIEQKAPSAILELSRKRAPIIIYISYCEDDKESYSINTLKESLKNRKEIRDIYTGTKNQIPEAQLMVYIATKNSLNDNQSYLNLKLALDNNIGIIPIKSPNIEWGELNRIDLGNDFKFSDLLGLEYYKIGESIEQICDDLYEHIKKYKREFNLFDSQNRMVANQLAKINLVCERFIESNEFMDNYYKNIKSYERLTTEVKNNIISHDEYIYQIALLLKS